MKSLFSPKGKHLRQLLLLALWAVAVAGFALARGYARTAVCDYVSIDGDFQSYNVFRRILAGQPPYVDFANYIGMAPVLINLPFLLFRGDFFASLFVTNATSSILFALAALCICYLATRRLAPSLLFSALAAKLSASGLLATLGGALGAEISSAWAGLYAPGNSMRIARSFLPFLLVLAILAAGRLLPRRLRLCPLAFFATPRRCAVCGLVLGLCITWASDYSLACIASASVILVLLHLTHYRAGGRRFLCCLFAYCAALAAGALISATVATGGAPGCFFASLSATGSAQYYYFNGTGSQPPVRYLLTCADFWRDAAFLLLYLVGCTVQLFCRRLDGRGLLLYFAGASVLAGTIAYILAGSGYSAREPLIGYSAVLAFSLLIRAAFWLAGKLPRPAADPHTPALAAAFCPAQRALAALCAIGLAGSCLLCVRDAAEQANAFAHNHVGVYVDALGGYTTYTKSLVDAAGLTAGETVFSIYATGLETVTGQFQPSGYDYAIHALGTSAQQAYLAAFLAADAAWVQTPDLPVDGWAALQNWYVYRYIWRYYQKAVQTDYSWLWARTQDQAVAVDAAVSITPNADGTVTLTVTSDAPGTYLADVHLCYSSAPAPLTHQLLALGRSAVLAVTGSLYADDNAYFACALPGEGEAYLPVILTDGSGSLTLSPQYSGGGAVSVSAAEVEAVLPRWNLHSDTVA